MTCSIQLRIDGDLLGVARVMRVLKRHQATRPEVVLHRELDHEVARVHATLESKRRLEGLAAALLKVPAVLDALILDDEVVVAQFSRWPRARYQL